MTDDALDGDSWRPLAIGAARDGKNDHRRIAWSKRPWCHPLPSDAVQMRRRSRAWLEAVLATPFEGSSIVVTHHAPSRRRIAPAPLRTGLEACYASALDELVASSGAAL